MRIRDIIEPLSCDHDVTNSTRTNTVGTQAMNFLESQARAVSATICEMLWSSRGGFRQCPIVDVRRGPLTISSDEIDTNKSAMDGHVSVDIVIKGNT